MKTTLRLALAAAALCLMAVQFSGCAGPYTPVNDGKCNVGREWVPPAQANGKWTEGYCREAK